MDDWSKPLCKFCGDYGKGAEFNLCSMHGVGTFCVRCEELVPAEVLRMVESRLGTIGGVNLDKGGEYADSKKN